MCRSYKLTSGIIHQEPFTFVFEKEFLTCLELKYHKQVGQSPGDLVVSLSCYDYKHVPSYQVMGPHFTSAPLTTLLTLQLQTKGEKTAAMNS